MTSPSSAKVDLDALRALFDKAKAACTPDTMTDFVLEDFTSWGDWKPEVAAYMTAALNSLPALVAKAEERDALAAKVEEVRGLLKACVEASEVARCSIEFHRQGLTVPGEPRMDAPCPSLDQDGSLGVLLEESEARARKFLTPAPAAGRGEV